MEPEVRLDYQEVTKSVSIMSCLCGVRTKTRFSSRDCSQSQRNRGFYGSSKSALRAVPATDVSLHVPTQEAINFK